MNRLRHDLAAFILDLAYPQRTPRLRDIEEGLRDVIRDPIEAKRKIGRMYGWMFKRREEHYDAGGAWLWANGGKR